MATIRRLDAARLEADEKIVSILEEAKASAERFFEMDKPRIDQRIELTNVLKRKKYIAKRIKKCRRTIEGLEGFEHESMQDLPVDIRPYNPNRWFHVLRATLDLIDGQATEEDLTRLFTMKYREGLELAYLNLLIGEAQPDTPKDRLSQRAIALLHFYNGEPILKGSHATDIAKKYGWVSINSGEAIYNHYREIQRKTNRTQDPGSKKGLETMFGYFESILDLITDPKKRIEAEDELRSLRTNLKLYEK